jgi:hypothetical protein
MKALSSMVMAPVSAIEVATCLRCSSTRPAALRSDGERMAR